MSTPTDPTPCLVKLLPTVSRAFTRWMDAQLEGDGMSPARVRLLAVLHCGGERTMTALSEELDVTPRNVTALVDGLEAEGMVQRVPHPTDRRATIVEMTAEGRTRFEQMSQPFVQKVSGLLGELPEADRRELIRLLEALLGVIHGRGGRADAPCGERK